MKKTVTFPFYSERWITGTALMDWTEKGQYIDLVCHFHHHGHLTLEEMMQILGGPVRPKVLEKLTLDENEKYYSKAFDKIMTEWDNFKKSQSEKGKKGMESRWGKDNPVNNPVNNPVTDSDNPVINRTITSLSNSLSSSSSKSKTKSNSHTQEPEIVCEIRDALGNYFGFTEHTNFTNFRLATNFAEWLVKHDRVEEFRITAGSYISYKKMTGEKRHSFRSFIGDHDDYSGGWITENWEHKLQDYAKRNPEKFKERPSLEEILEYAAQERRKSAD